MPFLWTLQRYILREMGKTFLLTVIALTAILGLGGGVLQVIKLGAVTPAQLARLILVMMPLSIVLTLPIAALFSASATYGRLAGDNEFVACRSSGINLLVLFLPAILLGLASAMITFVLSNFVIPGMVRNLNEFLFADVGTLLQRRLDSPRGIALAGYRLHADEFWVDPEDPNRFGLFDAAFVERGETGWSRLGTAREVSLVLHRDGNSVSVEGMAYGVRHFDCDDHGACQFSYLEANRSDRSNSAPYSQSGSSTSTCPSC